VVAWVRIRVGDRQGKAVDLSVTCKLGEVAGKDAKRSNGTGVKIRKSSLCAVVWLKTRQYLSGREFGSLLRAMPSGEDPATSTRHKWDLPPHH
jgi:hypothetical protein